MKKAPDFASIYASQFHNYISFMVNCGRVFKVEKTILKAFDRFICTHDISEIVEENVNAYVYSVPFLTPEQYHKRQRIVYGFCKYLHMKEEGKELSPPPMRYNGKRHIAHVYSKQELCMLLEATKDLLPTTSLRPHSYRVLFTLLYTCGLRVSEAIALDIKDVNFDYSYIFVCNTKFRKSRLVPVHKSMLDELRQYADLREALIPKRGTEAFFINNRCERMSYSMIDRTFLDLSRKLGFRGEKKGGPRIHDLRHTFAVHRVASWYENGENIQEKLPLLATYMGHAHFEDTTYYLMAGAELMAQGAKRFTREEQSDA